MRIGIIIPDRGDRPEFINHFFKMLRNQSIIKKSKRIMPRHRPEHIDEIVTDEDNFFFAHINSLPHSDACDITERYRCGYDFLRNLNLDVILLCENDDWYSPQYIETMVDLWDKNGRPDLFGLDHTIYYHIGLRKWYKMNHKVRSSAMNTLIKPDLNFEWCPDHEPFTDIWLWVGLKAGLSKVIVTPPFDLCLGIKHGVGKCGGKNHTTELHRFINDDENLWHLRSVVDNTSLEFYKQFKHIENETN